MARQRFNNTKDNIKKHGEVFTPTELVNQMLDKLPEEHFTENQTCLDPSCGNGQFLINVVIRKIKAGHTHKEALSTTYGCDISPKNVTECRKRLLAGSKDKTLLRILEVNIRCADALDENHSGWSEVGYMWRNNRK